MRVLVAAVQNHPISPTDAASLAAAADPDALFDGCRKHTITHRVLDWLQAWAPDHPTTAMLDETNRSAALLDLRVRGALRSAVGALHDAGIGFVAMKGPVLASIAGGSAIRPYADLDMLVAPEDLEATANALASAGSTVMPYSGWKYMLQQRHGQIPVILPMRVSLDLHWHLCSEPFRRAATSVESARDLIGRAETIDLKGKPVPVLNRVDMLLHTAAHAAWSGGDRLSWFVDVDSVVRWASAAPGGLDWDLVVSRAQAWGVAPFVNDMLTRTAAVIGTAVPTEVTHALGHNSVSRMLRVVERISPLHADRQDHAMARLVRVEVRRNLSATLASVSGRYGNAVLRRVRRDSIEDGESPVVGRDDEQWRLPYMEFARTDGSR